MGAHQDALNAVDGWLDKGFVNSWGMRIEDLLLEGRYRAIRSLILVELDRTGDAKQEMIRAERLICNSGQADISDGVYVRLIRRAAQRREAGQLVAIADRFLAEMESSGRMNTTPHVETVDKNLARANELKAEGRFDEAESVLREALKEVELFETTHPPKITAMLNMGVFLVEVNRLSEAEPYLWCATDAYAILFGDQHRLSIQSLGLFADVLVRQGKCDKAETILPHMMRKVSVSSDIPSSYSWKLRALYAICLSRQNRFDEASEQIKACYDELKETFGDDHDASQAAVRWLIELSEYGNLPNEESRWRLRLTSWKDTNLIGDTADGFICTFLFRNFQCDPLVEAVGQHNSAAPEQLREEAVRFNAVGRTDEAEACLRQALSASSNYGKHHPARMAVLHDLAGFLSDKGELVEAERLQREILDWSERTFGSYSQSAILAKAFLGQTMRRRQKYAGAEQLLREVVMASELDPDVSVPFQVQARTEHATSLIGLGRLKDAIEELKRCYDALRSTLGESHPETLAAANWIADLSDRVGNDDEATEYRDNATVTPSTPPTTTPTAP